MSQVEIEVAPLFRKGKTMTFDDLLPLSDKVHGDIKGARIELERATRIITCFTEDVEVDLLLGKRSWI